MTEDSVTTELALEEMRRSYQEYGQAADQLDQKLSTLLANASLILGLFAVLQLSLIRPGQSWLYNLGVALVIIAYLVLLSIVLSAYNPKVYKTPVQAEWDVLSQGFFTKAYQESLLILTSSYVERIKVNRKINADKATQVRIATSLLAVIILLLFVLSILPR